MNIWEKWNRLYERSGRAKSRAVLQRAATAAGFDLARLSPASAPRATEVAPQNAIDGPKIRSTDLHARTQPEYWRNYEPGARSEFDRDFDHITNWRQTGDDDAEMAEFERAMDRWSRRGRLRSSYSRSTAFDAAAEFLSPAQTVEEAKRTVTETFGHDRSCDFLSLEYMLKRLPPQSLVREVPEGQRQAMSAILARLDLA